MDRRAYGWVDSRTDGIDECTEERTDGRMDGYSVSELCRQGSETRAAGVSGLNYWLEMFCSSGCNPVLGDEERG